MQQVSIQINNGTDEFDILGHTFKRMPNGKCMAKDVKDRICEDISEGIFTYISADDLISIACHEDTISLNEYISNNCQEIYCDIHEIEAIFAIRIDGQSVDIFETGE